MHPETSGAHGLIISSFSLLVIPKIRMHLLSKCFKFNAMLYLYLCLTSYHIALQPTHVYESRLLINYRLWNDSSYVLTICESFKRPSTVLGFQEVLNKYEKELMLYSETESPTAPG